MMEQEIDLALADRSQLLQHIARLEKDNAKLRKINKALIYRVESGMADNGNSFTIFQVSAELEKRIQERTHALERAMNELKTSNIALEEARLAAEQANNRLGVAVDTIADGFAQWDQHDRLVRFNQRFVELQPALRRHVRSGMQFAEYLDHLADSGSALEALGQVDCWREQRIQLHRDSSGSYLEALSDGRYLRISERQTADGGRVAIYTDISEIKRQEQRLRQQDQAAHRQLLEATVNSLRQGIAVFDHHSLLLAWNHRFCELAGLSPAILRVGQALPASAEIPLLCPVNGSYEVETVSGLVLEIESCPMPNAGFVITCSDVTARKRDELALRESESKLRLITDALPALISYVDKDQIYRFTNKGYEDWFGLPVQEINGRTLREVLGPALYDPRQHFVERALAGVSSVFELKMPAPKRSVEYAQAAFIPHIGEDGVVHGFYALIQDITQTRRAEQVLTQAKQELELRVTARTSELRRANSRLQEAIVAAEEANRSKTRFFAAASHDLLQPLNAARLFVASLAEREARGENMRLVQHAASSLEAVDDLINTLLELSRIDAGAIEVECSHFHIDQLLRQLSIEFSPLVAERGLSLRSHLCGAVVYSDWVLLSRILRNFLSNALRYSEHGRLLLAARRTTEGVLVGVWDQGQGIPADKLAQVFEEFQRLPEHRAMCSKGLGLGLAIVKRLATRLQHRLEVRSQHGRGSFFGIVLPYGEQAAASAMPRQQEGISTVLPSELQGLTILLIDNEPAILAGMTTLLSGWGCLPLAATGLDEARALLGQLSRPPDVILADYHLDHGASGPQVILALCHQLQLKIPAAIITADRSPEVAAEVAGEGWSLLSKPVRPARLRALIGHLGKLALQQRDS
ncbi:hybrid sensor histidine kinase/response regulator [Aquitalea palustris]|nr:PAS domain-containing hybrid sensor histidine kinase/response regulator [Aquitalea palustris]